jgi:hypothetical protein
VTEGRRKPDRWSSAGDLVRSFSYRTGTANDKLTILSSVWDKECGTFARHWTLVGVKKGVQELHMRSGGLVKALNKYFSRPWLTAVRTTYR